MLHENWGMEMGGTWNDRMSIFSDLVSWFGSWFPFTSHFWMYLFSYNGEPLSRAPFYIRVQNKKKSCNNCFG
jgi:hypothetical protein